MNLLVQFLSHYKINIIAVTIVIISTSTVIHKEYYEILQAGSPSKLFLKTHFLHHKYRLLLDSNNWIIKVMDINEVNNQQDATTFSFINLLNQSYMFRATNSPILRSIFDCIYSFWYNAPVGSIVGAVYQKLYIQSNVLLRMGESVARNI